MKEIKERKAAIKRKDTTLEKEEAKTDKKHLHATTEAIRATKEDEKAVERVFVLKEMAALNKTQMERLSAIKEAGVAEEQRQFIENVMALQEVMLWTEALTVETICTAKNRCMNVSAANDGMLTDEEPTPISTVLLGLVRRRNQNLKM